MAQVTQAWRQPTPSALDCPSKVLMTTRAKLCRFNIRLVGSIAGIEQVIYEFSLILRPEVTDATPYNVRRAIKHTFENGICVTVIAYI